MNNARLSECKEKALVPLGRQSKRDKERVSKQIISMKLYRTDLPKEQVDLGTFGFTGK